VIADLGIQALGWVLHAVLAGMLAPLQLIPQSWLDGMHQLGPVFDAAGSMSAWIPITLAVSIGSVILVTWGISMGLQLVRMILSYLTFGGGAH